MRAYYFDNVSGDNRLPHDSSRPVSDAVLEALGVLHWRVPREDTDWEQRIDAVATEREYKNRDTISVSRESLGEQYEARMKAFYDEHMHEDEEIRYIMDGSCYFDVREHPTDAWIRLQLDAGDLVVLPAGIYHRFTVDTNDSVKAMRLFKDAPKWIALPRGVETDANPHRVGYLKAFPSVSVGA